MGKVDYLRKSESKIGFVSDRLTGTMHLSSPSLRYCMYLVVVDELATVQETRLQARTVAVRTRDGTTAVAVYARALLHRSVTEVHTNHAIAFAVAAVDGTRARAHEASLVVLALVAAVCLRLHPNL